MMASAAGAGCLRVTLYTKEGCHLCEDLRDLLQDMRPELKFTLVELDIERNPDDFERYREVIPVLEIPGVGKLFPPHDVHAVREAISSAARART